MDATLRVRLFFGVGFVLDRWLGTRRWFMIGMILLAAVGLFITFKYRYDAAMDRLEAERLAPRSRDARPHERTRPHDHPPRRAGARGHVSQDMVRRGSSSRPLLIAVCAVIWGADGAWSALFGIALVLVNFALAAASSRRRRASRSG